jgi:hypothetical protein
VLEPGDDDGPTVITVEGAWGSGKSTLLEMVKDRLRAQPVPVRRRRRLTVCEADWMLYRPPRGLPQPEQEPATNPLVVSFNPWRHQSSEQVRAGLARAVTEAAEAAIMPHQNNRERYRFARNAGRVDRRHLQRQLWKRIFSPLLSFAGSGFGLSLPGALSKLNIDGRGGPPPDWPRQARSTPDRGTCSAGRRRSCPVSCSPDRSSATPSPAPQRIR